jgi:hypothetical protein
MHFDNVVCRPLTLAHPAQVELDLVWRLNNENPVLNRLLPALAPSASPSVPDAAQH